MTDVSIALGRYFKDFVERQVTAGRYESPSDVVKAALRLLEEHEAELEWLRSALIEGEQSGVATPFDFDAFLERKQRDHDKASMVTSAL